MDDACHEIIEEMSNQSRLCVNMNRTFKNSSTKLVIHMLLPDVMESEECGKYIILASAYLIL